MADVVPQPAILIQAFVSAQVVHFCSVVMLHTKFATERLQLGAPQVAVVLAGLSIVLGVGVTATPSMQSRIYGRAAHVVMPYLIWLIPAADYAQHPIRSLRFLEIPIVLALVLRHLPLRGDRH